MKLFLLGILFAELGLPIMDGIVTIYSQVVQNICAILAVKVCRINLEIQEIQQEMQQKEQPSNNAVIGFEYPIAAEQIDEEQEE